MLLNLVYISGNKRRNATQRKIYCLTGLSTFLRCSFPVCGTITVIVMSQAIHHPWSKCGMSYVIRTWQENWARGMQVWQMCTFWQGLPPRWQRQRLVLGRWPTDRQQIVSETPFGDREHTNDRWDGGSCRVSRPREEGKLERFARAVEGLRVKLNQKQIQSRYISSGLCAWMLVCVCYLRLPLLVAYLMWLQM